ncbi:MAG: UbiD family decarboxylase, partial [Deltaproteobacteria bacterium]|nr:UbiD family decarboxylase [Deltaproteobacteria bacterium]
PPKMVDSGPLMENVLRGEEVDMLKIPVPIWHELDGGPYIGTGLAVIVKDPDTGWVNLGSYRLQLHDRYTTGLFCEPENDGRAIIEKYWKAGKPCPVAISLGPEPIIFLTASGSTGCPKRVPEYDYAGFILDEPIPVIEGPLTGLPISAHSEIAVEGEIPPPDSESRPE